MRRNRWGAKRAAALQTQTATEEPAPGGGVRGGAPAVPAVAAPAGYPGSCPAPAAAPDTTTPAVVAPTKRQPREAQPQPPISRQAALRPGHRVARVATGEQGCVEFAPEHAAEVLVLFGADAEDLSALAWVPQKDLRLIDASQGYSTERADVRAYRDALRALELVGQGLPVEQVASQLHRPEAWVRQKAAVGSPARLPKPRGMEWWDPKGFCDVTYLRGYARESGLYEEIVQGVEWEQDKVWRVRKEEGSDAWHLRTVKECPGRPGRGFCGRSLQKVPDTTHQIGPQDRRQAARTRPHADWACELAATSQGRCQKPSLGSAAVEPYWWCPACRWYACDACAREMPDKATSKQVWHWRPGECPRFDTLVSDLVRDFALPDPMRERYTVKMNWYPDAFARVSPHRHDNWTLLLSLGEPRVLTVDRARVLMEDGDVVLFGTQSHGVPEMPSCSGGRLSVVLMFAPDECVGSAAAARVAAGGSARRGLTVPGMPVRPTAGLSFDAFNGALDDGDSFGEADCPPLTAEEEAGPLGALCGLGFHRADAAAALAATGGDAEQAAAILLAAVSGP